ncbi:hypothetical protein EYF80_061937 [Liparis tanakae]|uniref:Uncharacterized protein n=1 Tax=Liparis tanakae TaxID=230148 RepID=A0A4Z2EGB2_9TELE|nr:hypothetical protein EYF80_061937 [Liparis tanakae]
MKPQSSTLSGGQCYRTVSDTLRESPSALSAPTGAHVPRSRSSAPQFHGGARGERDDKRRRPSRGPVTQTIKSPSVVGHASDQLDPVLTRNTKYGTNDARKERKKEEQQR